MFTVRPSNRCPSVADVDCFLNIFLKLLFDEMPTEDAGFASIRLPLLQQCLRIIIHWSMSTSSVMSIDLGLLDLRCRFYAAKCLKPTPRSVLATNELQSVFKRFPNEEQDVLNNVLCVSCPRVAAELVLQFITNWGHKTECFASLRSRLSVMVGFAPCFLCWLCIGLTTNLCRCLNR